MTSKIISIKMTKYVFRTKFACSLVAFVPFSGDKNYWVERKVFAFLK
jgi:hypothetical protein